MLIDSFNYALGVKLRLEIDPNIKWMNLGHPYSVVNIT